MDNNKAENSIRNPVTGRRNFYGSGSLWSYQLTAMMFSIFQSKKLGGLNCRHWIRSYLTAPRDQFIGTCNKAANWQLCGQTKGRGRLGPAGKISVPIKNEMEPLIAVGREKHNQPLKDRFCQPAPLADDADPIS